MSRRMKKRIRGRRRREEDEMMKRSRDKLRLVVPTQISQFTTRADINNCICLHNAFKSRMTVTHNNDRSFSCTALTNGSL
jgi:hypothetical protein